MDLNRQIESAEKKYKQILEGFFVSVYKEKYLLSHGLSHHRRVWCIAKELTLSLYQNNLLNDFCFPDSLIIACYLHDIGMAVEHGPDHGKHSAQLTGTFLRKNNLSDSNYPGLLEAVMMHDKKDYSTPASINLHSVLSMADDLDAFGITGIYRYIEIYSIRGIALGEIGEKIRLNAANRFRHFAELMSFDETLVGKHRERYEILINFCLDFEKDLSKEKADSGYLKVAEIIASMVQSDTVQEEMIIKHEHDPDPVVKSFFMSLRNELNNS